MDVDGKEEDEKYEFTEQRGEASTKTRQQQQQHQHTGLARLRSRAHRPRIVERRGGREEVTRNRERWTVCGLVEALVSCRGKPGEKREDAWNKSSSAKGSQVRTPCRASELTRRPPTITGSIDQLGEPVDAHRSVRPSVRRRPRRESALSPSAFRLPPSTGSPLCPFRRQDRLIPESDVDVGCRLRSGIADSNDYLASILAIVIVLLHALCFSNTWLQYDIGQ